MKTEELIAINIHTHAEVSCWNPFDHYGEAYSRSSLPTPVGRGRTRR